MKKIITVLTILAVLAGALFAASESHTIKITVTIDNSEPTFTLKTSSGVVADVSSAVENPVAVLSDANKTALAGVSGTASVGFAIQQTSNANSVSTYRLYVTVSDLVLTSNGSPLENPTSTEKFTVVSAHPTISGGDTTVTNITYPVPEVADEYYRVKYDGVVNLTNSTPITLGTFTASYNANANAKPGSYVSTVSLSIETP